LKSTLLGCYAPVVYINIFDIFFDGKSTTYCCGRFTPRNAWPRASWLDKDGLSYYVVIRGIWAYGSLNKPEYFDNIFHIFTLSAISMQGTRRFFLFLLKAFYAVLNP